MDLESASVGGVGRLSEVGFTPFTGPLPTTRHVGDLGMCCTYSKPAPLYQQHTHTCPTPTATRLLIGTHVGICTPYNLRILRLK